jgi:hypothetical protein
MVMMQKWRERDRKTEGDGDEREGKGIEKERKKDIEGAKKGGNSVCWSTRVLGNSKEEKNKPAT